jgi:hypothetical protein
MQVYSRDATPVPACDLVTRCMDVIQPQKAIIFLQEFSSFRDLDTILCALKLRLQLMFNSWDRFTQMHAVSMCADGLEETIFIAC